MNVYRRMDGYLQVRLDLVAHTHLSDDGWVTVVLTTGEQHSTPFGTLIIWHEND